MSPENRFRSDSLSIVSAGASGGAAVGVILNGVLVSTSGSMHNWRVSFWIAVVFAGLAIAVALAVFRKPIAKPASTSTALVAVFRKVLVDPSGRMVVGTSAVSGVAVFTLATFLTATSIDEMGASDTATALLLWIGGSVGVGSALVFGKLGDRRTPTFAIATVMGDIRHDADGACSGVVISSPRCGCRRLRSPQRTRLGTNGSRRHQAIQRRTGGRSYFARLGCGICVGCYWQFGSRRLDRRNRLNAWASVGLGIADIRPHCLFGPRNETSEQSWSDMINPQFADGCGGIDSAVVVYLRRAVRIYVSISPLPLTVIVPRGSKT